MRPPLHLLPLILASGLIVGSAAAQNAASPDEQKAARAEIETLSKRIEELSKKLGPDSGVHITVIERSADGKTVERRVVRTAPDGTIVGRRLTKSSGVTSWDEAVLKAIDKTEVLPRDVDGTVWTPMTIIFRPKD